jgi:hypothetical protein
VPVIHKRNITPLDHFHRNIYKAVCLHLRLYCGVDVTMVANEVNKFGQIFRIHRVISILLISPPKVIYAELVCVKDIPHFFPNLFQNHPVCKDKESEEKLKAVISFRKLLEL